MSKVGEIYKLKVPCLKNPVGTCGIVFYDYGDGIQLIFPNGEYDGFSLVHDMPEDRGVEADYFLEYFGIDSASTNYEFKNVMQVSKDFNSGRWFKN